VPLGVTPKGDTLCPGSISNIMQTFMVIGVTIAEISVQILRYSELQQKLYQTKCVLALHLSIKTQMCMD